VRRLLLLAVLATACVAAPEALAARECDGLDVCVPVAGPWVVVPTPATTPRPSVRFQLTCPRGHVVAGVDAELSHRTVDVTWAALPGSPVNPGISTERSALFTAVHTGVGTPPATFRPHIGCIPAAGGGGRIPTSLDAVFPPAPPPVRRVRTARVRPGTATVTQRCGAGERIVGAWHAVGFGTARPPGAALLRTVRATRTLRAGTLRVTIRATAALGARQAFVQAGVVCGARR
jgi:hypothetical protein